MKINDSYKNKLVQKCFPMINSFITSVIDNKIINEFFFD